MNVFEFDIWCSVKHNGKFSHTVTRMEVIHALNKERAKKKITLQKGETRTLSGGLEITSSDEFIYSVRRTGNVTKQLFYVYSDGRTSRPVK